MKTLTTVRSLAIGKANTLQRCHRHLEALRPAFAEWADGEIYVCKKTGSYRYRFGAQSKSPAPWSKLAVQIFESPAAFAFAAMVLAPAVVEAAPVEQPKPATVETSGRANIIHLARVA
jgi:hypothetical protein